MYFTADGARTRRKASNGVMDHGRWLTRERLTSIVLVLATALAVYWSYLLVQPFLPALAWALAFAVVADPLHDWIAARVRKPSLAAGLAVALVTLIIIAPMAFLVEELVGEVSTGIGFIKSESDTGDLLAGVQHNRTVTRAIAWLNAHIDLRAQGERLASRLADILTGLLAGSANVALQLLIALFVLFYFFRDKHKVLTAVRSSIPLDTAETDKIMHRIADTVHATIHGTMGIAAIKGVLGGSIFAILGLPAAILWGTVMAAVSVLPVLGTMLVWVPAAGYLLMTGHWAKALILTLYGLIVMGLSDNILYPLLIGGRMRMHPLLVFFAILGGMSLLGTTGLILGPVIVAAMLALIDEWRRRTEHGAVSG